MTMTARLSAPDIDRTILDEAAGWLVLLQSGDASADDRANLEQWRGRSPAHEMAWQRAEGMLRMFRQVPPALGHGTLRRLNGPDRRRILSLALAGIMAPGAAWLAWHQAPWREWSADLRTATGERRTIDLADGTRLVLNTASAVDMAFTPTERRLTLLAGEILVTTGKDPSPVPRPFTVHTDQGSLRPVGTRFTVRGLEERTRVAVFEGAVEVRPALLDRQALLRAGEQMEFAAGTLLPVQPADEGSALWERGMLLARDMQLGELVAELARYRRGILRCDPAVAGLPVSGAFPVGNTDASLALLEKTLPVRVGRTTGYWVTVQAR